MSYSYIIQKDLPLIAWKIDGTLSGSATQDGYMTTIPGSGGSTSNGSITGSLTNKPISILHGSPNSAYITSGTSISVPAMGMATNRFASNPMTLEFWIKPKTHLYRQSMTKIVGKNGSQTGVYVHNSSFIGIVGDTAGNIAKVVIPVDNMSKPFHIAFVYQEESVSLIVNGIGKTAQIKNNVLTNTSYSYSDDKFIFQHPGLDYAIDNISIFAYPMSQVTARRHMVYGLGYEFPDSVATEFGGYRYNVSLSQTQLACNIQKYNAASWMNNSEVDNLVIENNQLRINKFEEPTRKYAKDKTSSIFSFTSNEFRITEDGGYLELFPQRYGSYIKKTPAGAADSNPNGSGFACIIRTPSSLSGVQTIMSIQDPVKQEYSLKIYLNGSSMRYQLNNGSEQTLASVSGNTNYAVGYFYNSDLDTVTIFMSPSSGSPTISIQSNPKLFPLSYSATLRLMSNDVFDENDNVTGLSNIERFTGGLLKVIQLDILSTSYSALNSEDFNSGIVHKYKAVANSTEKRFIVYASGQISFKIDAKRLAGPSGIIGPNRVEWGHGGIGDDTLSEVKVSAYQIGISSANTYTTYTALDNAFSTYQQIDNQFTSYQQIYRPAENNWIGSNPSLSNRKPIQQIMGKSVGDTKALEIVMKFQSTDVVENPTMVSYFRLFALNTEADGSDFKSTIVCKGPDIDLYFDSSNTNLVLPDYRETPFLWTEENGGFRVGKQAKIIYDSSTVTGATSDVDTVGGLCAISMMINLDSTTTKPILSVTDGTRTSSLSLSSGSFSVSNGSVYVNGAAGGSPSAGVWTNIIFVFSNRMQISSLTGKITITISPGFQLDEITTLDGVSGDFTSGVISQIYKLYNGNNIATYTASSGIARLAFIDQEISNSNEIYLPMIVPNGGTLVTQTALLEDVDLASYANRSQFNGTQITYNGPNSLIIDGTYIQTGDRILLKNQNTPSNNGIYLVGEFVRDAATDKIISIPMTKIPSLAGNLVYVKDGVANKGTHWITTNAGENWIESPYMKKVDAYTFEGSTDKTDLEAKATITV